MKILILISLFFLNSCNVIEAISDADGPSDDFFDDTCNNCDSLFDNLIFYHSFNVFPYNAPYNSIDLIAQGGLTDPSSSGQKGTAVDCNNITNANYLDSVANYSDFAFGTTEDFSLSFWVNRNAQAGASPVFFSIDTASADFSLNQTAAADTLTALLGGRVYTSTGNAFNNGNWNHVVIRFDRDVGAEFCINGACEGYSGTASNSDDMQTDGRVYFCVRYDLGSTILDARIDSFGMWNRLLTDSEISRLTNQQTSLE